MIKNAKAGNTVAMDTTQMFKMMETLNRQKGFNWLLVLLLLFFFFMLFIFELDCSFLSLYLQSGTVENPSI